MRILFLVLLLVACGAEVSPAPPPILSSVNKCLYKVGDQLQVVGTEWWAQVHKVEIDKTNDQCLYNVVHRFGETKEEISEFSYNNKYWEFQLRPYGK